MDKNIAWGWLTTIDARYCNENINSPEIIQEFINEILEKIEMVPIGGTHILWCDTHDPAKIGYSVYQLLQDSNISIHFCPANQNQAYLDLFSCRPYEHEIVEALFRKYFGPKTLALGFHERLAPLLDNDQSASVS